MTAEYSLRDILIPMLYVICVMGITVNLTIMAANLMKWKSQKSLQTCDKILCYLALARSLCFSTIIVRNLFFAFFPWLAKNKIVISALYILTWFMFYNSHWIATILCVFYCVKIVTYNYKFFIFLKTRISTMVPWLILASLSISLISSLPFGWYGYELIPQNLSNISTEKLKGHGRVAIQNFDNQFLIFTFGCFLQFLIFCGANFLLIYFLLMHTLRMRSNGSQIQSPNLKSHFRALKSMSLFLLLQILSFICMNLSTSGKFGNFKFQMLIGWIVLCSPPLLHSLYLMSCDNDVKKMLISLCLWLVRCF